MATINGRLINATTRATMPDHQIEAWSTDRRRRTPLARATTDKRGTFSLEVTPQSKGVSFRVYREGQPVLDTTGTETWTPDHGDKPIVVAVPDAVDPHTNDAGAVFSVEGTVATELGVAAANLKVEIWDHDVHGATLITTTTTDERGRYTLLYDPASLSGKLRPDLEVRVLDPARKDALLTSSAVMYQAAPKVEFDPVVDAAHMARTPEFTRLHESIDPLLKDTPLGEVDAAGVTYLAERSGWDARAVAMAAEAARVSAESRIPAEHCYALLRTGVPGEADNLHRFSDAQVASALALAQKSDIIGTDASVEQTVELHRELATKRLLEITPPTAVSSLGDMLEVGLAADDRSKFLDVYRNSGDDPARLWEGLEQSGFGDKQIAMLRATSALGRMTFQNAPVVGRLIRKERVRGLDDLATNGYHTAAKWSKVIGDDVPAGLTRGAYAAGLAARVRIAAPTLVAADLVRSKQIGLNGAGDEVATFLTAAHGTHTIGVEPMHAWDGFDELSDGGKSGARLVERLYQISPSNESMAALARLGLESAKQIAAYPRDAFLGRFGDEFPSHTEALLVHEKAVQVHTTALNVATMYLAHRSMPNVYAISGTTGRPAPKPAAPAAGATGAAAGTLEDLFQNMDYCSCQDCNSVFSAAAYLVELLEFLDLTGEPHDKQNPIDVLLGRRPDLQHIQLSCENTNVVVPYVDLVNEVLEYYVVNGNLTGFTSHDMTSASKTADLLANPQYVQDAAYDETLAKVYPWSLPFDRPLAAMRQLFTVLDTTLPDALSVAGDAAGARRERLGLNLAEYRILTEVGFHSLPEYFGLPAVASIDDLNDAVANAKSFCRAADITYEDLAAILETRFVNPGIGLVPLLQELHVGLETLEDWFEGGITNAELDALLPPGLDQGPYGGDVHGWLTANRAVIMGLITLTDVSADPVECDFAEVELRYALPDPAANRLDEIAYLRLNRFIRLWRKLDLPADVVDDLVTSFLGVAPEQLTPANIDSACVAMLARLGNFEALLVELSVSRRAVPDWMSLWASTLDPTVRSDRLAGLLRAGTVDMADLIEMTGIDPFADDLDADEPSILRFARAWRAVKASPLKVADLDYLLRHQDAIGKLEPTDDELLRNLKLLRDAMTAVDADLGTAAVNPDLNATKAKMALVYDSAVVDRLFALISHSTTYSAPFATTEETLPAPLEAAGPAIDLDPFGKQLTFTGIMSAAAQTALDTAADALTVGDLAPGTTGAQRNAYVAAFKTAVQALRDAGAADLQSLADDYPELAALFSAADALTDPAAKSVAVLDAILPELRDGLKTLALRTTLTAITKMDAPGVDTITTRHDVLHADGDAAHGALDDFRALEDTIDLDADGTFDLLIDPMATSDYVLYVAAPENTSVTLSLDGTVVIPATAVGASGEVQSAVPIALVTGGLNRLQLTLAGLPAAGRARLRWRTKAAAKADVPASRLYAKAAVDTARASLLRIGKVALLQKALGLTAGELRHFAATEPTTSGVLDDLDTDGSIGGPALHALWAKVEQLLWFTRLKADHEPDPDTFLSIFGQPGRTTPQGKLVVAAVMEWDETSLADVLAHHGLAQADLAHLDSFREVAHTLDLVATTMQPAADLLAWAVPNPTGTLVASAQEALHTRMTDAAWRDLMQGVSDPLRNQSRDALVAYILFHATPDPSVKTPDQLYEHFLVDVQMDACMQTSRIRLALSTVQLFITRCLMNLEDDVSPASIRADRWQWMQRYRVWEANRRVFVYPENWLEPELRDNKSPFFRELESELLKSDITDDAAEEAYLSYLKKLDDVAKLEVVGAFLHQQHPGTPDEDILHVFARTNGITRQYYSRRFEYGYWTPWEKMPLNIDADMVVPVVWKSQLFVFWASTVQKKDEDKSGQTPWQVADDPWAGHAKFTVEVTLNWGEYYRGKWTSPKSSEMTDPLRITGVGSYDASKLVITAHTEQPGANLSERLVMPVLYLGGETAAFLVTFTSKHSPPLVEEQNVFEGLLGDPVKTFNYSLFWEDQPGAVLESNSLRLTDRTMEVGVEQPDNASVSRKQELVLTKSASLLGGFRLRPLMHPIDNQWNAPFFYSDEHSLFSVEAREVIWDRSWLDIFYDTGPSIAFDIDEIPPVYEKPVIPNRGDPVINPWEKVVNQNFETIITDNVPFTFDGKTFDANGGGTAIGGRILMQVDYHNAADNYAVTTGELQWIVHRRPARDVRYDFATHYHPYSETLIERLNLYGLPALLDATWQKTLELPLAPARYQPGAYVDAPFPMHEIDVSDDGPYAIYNWELFFHAPVLIATHLSKNQRFAEAQRWFHYVFDPTSTDPEPVPERFWKFLRFRQETTPEFIDEMLKKLAEAGESEVKTRLQKAITAWRDKPFQPHVVARTRYLAYQMNVVMKYLDNLIAWGDFLFRQDTIETLNEATQIYVLAANVLGPKPQRVPPRGERSPKTYAQLKAAGIDDFGNALVELENSFPFNSAPGAGGGSGSSGSTGADAMFGIGRSLYFAIPQNDMLLEYWARVGDRLFKIRHCMNIEGVVRQLALFDPPIDPGALVKAVAAGIDLGAIVNNINQPVSTIRGPTLLQKALELCSEVKSLGAAVLTATEKGEAEHLALLRQQHELSMNNLVRDVRFLQWKEAEAATEALLRSRATVWERYRHYKRILGASDGDVDGLKSLDLARTDLNEETFDAAYGALVSQYAVSLAREAYRKETSVGGLMEFAGQTVTNVFGGELGKTLPLNKNENAELNIFLPASDTFGTVASVFNVAAPILALIPQIALHATPVGVGGAATFGGDQLSKGAKFAGEAAKMISDTFRSSADRASKMASYYRRAEDYVLQANAATSELEQYGRQIISSLLREQIAKHEYENHLQQIENSTAQEQYLREKFTNEDLYTWMEGELSETYYESYKLAFDVAKRAEQTLKRELMRPEFDELDIIKFGYWDGSRRGLLAGEMLTLDLKRLEMAYLEQNRREFELTRHVSLARLDPIALLKLKASGSCEVDVPEWLFDVDSPGHYMRRLKGAGVSIPCVTGPYTGVHCTLSLLRSSVRVSSLAGDQYARNENGDDDRFRDYAGAIQSIVTSSAQNDTGLFDANVRDDRYLPFEGAGAIGTWRLELPNDVPQFDFESISDVVLHLRYTAREAGHLRADAASHVKEDVLQQPDSLLQLFGLSSDFGDEWNQFKQAADDASRTLELTVSEDDFPYWLKRLGMSDTLVATFGVIDWSKNKLTIAPATVALAGDADSGWTLSVDENSPVFAFLKKNRANKVYMAISYMME